MSSRQTRSKSRGRAVRKPARPLSRVRTDAYFSDPDYDQPTPEPKTASTPSPTWGKLSNKIIETRLYDELNGTETVPLLRPDGRRYYMSSACGPASYSSTGEFQDRVARPNASRAKAMTYPNSNFPETSNFTQTQTSPEDLHRVRGKLRYQLNWTRKSACEHLQLGERKDLILLLSLEPLCLTSHLRTSSCDRLKVSCHDLASSG